MAESMTRWKQNADIQEALEHGEGNVARAIEEQTAKLPSDAWLWAAFASIGFSLILHASGKREDGLFAANGSRRFCCSASTTKESRLRGTIAFPEGRESSSIDFFVRVSVPDTELARRSILIISPRTTGS
jgi:hypothetical protein